MERSSGFDDDDDDEEFGGRRDTSSYRGEFGVKGDGKNSGADQRPNTPRSKHSATEQRRRSKINDRFQILRELIPHSDQKRDKASFLLEVIEYIRFLQEKAQKYESSYPGWTEEDAKLMPWNHHQGSGDIADPSQVIKNGSVPTEFIFSGNDNIAPVVPTILSTTLHPSEPDMSSNVADKAAEDSIAFASKVTAASVSQPNLYPSIGRGTIIGQSPQLISDIHNMTSQSHSQWLRSPCPTDYAVNGDVLSEHEELAIDDGTISVSSAYSEGLLTALSQTLQSSGIDLSQASISVNINLGKRATNGRPTTATTMSSAKGRGDPSSGNGMVGRPTVGSSGEDSEQPCKRQKSDNS